MRVFQQKLILNSEIIPIFVCCFSCTRAVAVSSLCRDGWIYMVNAFSWARCVTCCLAVYYETMPNISLTDQTCELLANVKAMKRKSIAIKLKCCFEDSWGHWYFDFFFLFFLTRGSYTELYIRKYILMKLYWITTGNSLIYLLWCFLLGSNKTKQN